MANKKQKKAIKALRVKTRRMMTPRRTVLMLTKQKYGCRYCSKKLTEDNLTIEHRASLSNSRDCTIDNICLTCESCNGRKGTMSEELYIKKYSTGLKIVRIINFLIR